MIPKVIFLLSLLFYASESINLVASPLYGSNDCDYTMPVQIGNVTLYLIVDSGSSNIAVLSNQCTTTCASVLQPRYNGSLTTTAIDLNYGSGSLDGFIISSMPYNFSGTAISGTMESVGVTSQTLLSCGGIGKGQQGIVGMAFPALSADGLPVLMDVLAANNDVPDGFALQLCGNIPGADLQNKTGNIWIGGYDSSFTTGPMQYIAITQRDYYRVNLLGFTLNGVTLTFPQSLSEPWSIIDSGTTEIIFNTIGNYNHFLSVFMVSGAIKITSSVSLDDQIAFWDGEGPLVNGTYSINSTVIFTIDFEGVEGETVKIPIPASNWFLILDNGNVWFQAIGSEYTYDYSGGGTIVGETVFTNNVVFFDRTTAGNRIGFAPSHNCFGSISTAGIDFFPVGTGSCTAMTPQQNTSLYACLNSEGCGSNIGAILPDLHDTQEDIFTGGGGDVFHSNAMPIIDKKKRALPTLEDVISGVSAITCTELKCAAFCYNVAGCMSFYESTCIALKAQLPGCDVSCNGISAAFSLSSSPFFMVVVLFFVFLMT